MRNYFTFGGIDSRDYGVYLSGNGRFTIPERPYEILPVPGRMGDVVFGGNRISNVIVTYPCFMAPVDGRYGNDPTFQIAFNLLKNDLLSVNGYAELADSYSAYTSRRAVFAGAVTAEMTPDLTVGSFELAFNCSPKLMLSGVGPQTVTFTAGQSGEIRANAAYPRADLVLSLTGTGTLTIGNDTVTITQNPNRIIIDCARGICYDATAPNINRSQYVKLSNYRFPAINPIGEEWTKIWNYSSTGLSGEINFKWWML